jgi:ABC-type branched-subunit amino acid transport system substrate-binding protein
MATPTFTSQHQGTQIKVDWSIGLVLTLFISALLLIAAQARDNVIRIAVVDDFSGLNHVRGDRVSLLFDNYATEANAKGGIKVGHDLYKIELIKYDAGSDPGRAAAKMQEAVQRDQAAVAVCSHLSCVQAAEQTKTPLILTAAKSARLSHGETNTFLIWTPSPGDFELQANLAIKTLHEALTHAAEPTPEKITTALRDVDFSSGLGRVHFDKSGNNLGTAAYPFRPDTAGCTNSCGSSCPSNCGQTPCTKSGGNECCSICGMPRPEGND